MNQARRRPFLCTDVSIRFNGWVVYFKVVKEEAEVGAQAAEVKVVQADAQADLDVALPTLEKALKALDSLTKNDITEVKSFAKPPPAVQVVMEAVCILLEVWATGGEEKVSGFLICVIYALTSWVALGDLGDEGSAMTLSSFGELHISVNHVCGEPSAYNRPIILEHHPSNSLQSKTDWDSAKKVLADSSFMDKLKNYDKVTTTKNRPLKPLSIAGRLPSCVWFSLSLFDC